MAALYAVAPHPALHDVALALQPGEGVLPSSTILISSLVDRARVQLYQGKTRVWKGEGEETPNLELSNQTRALLQTSGLEHGPCPENAKARSAWRAANCAAATAPQPRCPPAAHPRPRRLAIGVATAPFLRVGPRQLLPPHAAAALHRRLFQ